MQICLYEGPTREVFLERAVFEGRNYDIIFLSKVNLMY